MAGIFQPSESPRKILTDYEVDSKIIDIKDLVYVNACMVDLADRWVRLGECLRVPEAKLSIIQAQNPDSDVRKCLVEMLAEWLSNNLEPTWKKIVTAIATTKGDESAMKVAKKLQDGTYSFITERIPGLDVDSVDSSILDSSASPDIISALHTAEVTNRWCEIGLFLGISYGRLETLKTKSDDDKVRGVVNFWMSWNYDYETFGKPSWKSLVRAIGNRAGGNAYRAAEKIATDHAAVKVTAVEYEVEDGEQPPPRVARPSGPQKGGRRGVELRDTENIRTVGNFMTLLKHNKEVLLIALIAILYLFIPKLISPSSDSEQPQRTNQLYSIEINTPLPVIKENFVVREEDMENITKLFKFYGDLRIVTILGMPGVGKSTTAIQLAHQLKNNGTAVMYVNLNGMEDVNGIKMKIVRKAFPKRQYNQYSQEINDTFEQWEYGCSKPLLLVFDNYDQLTHHHNRLNLAYLEFGMFVVHELNAYLKNTTMVITTREKEPTLFHHLLQIDNRNYTLQPLSDDISIDLLANQLQIPIHYTDRQQLRPIAELIGGVPIALGIAVGLIKGEGVDSTFKKLNESLKHLSPKELSAFRYHSVSACIWLSYDRLDDSDKRCGQYLSCFPGSFSEQTAISIVGSLPSQSSQSVNACLPHLVQQSLLQLSSYSDGVLRYDFHKLLKDFFNNELNLHEGQLQFLFDRMFLHRYIEGLEDFRLQYLNNSKTTLAETTVDRHNLLHMLHILERIIQKNTSDAVVSASVDTIIDTMSLKYGSILAHLFTSFEIHQSLMKIVEYADHQYEKKFKESVLPQDFTRYATAVVFWMARYSYAHGKLPTEGSLSVMQLERKVEKYVSSISTENCSFPDVILPSIRVFGITCYDTHHHTKLSLCPKGNETIVFLREQLAKFNHTKCADTDLGELGLAHFELKNTQTAINFLEMHIEVRSPEINPISNPHIFVTLCKAYSRIGRADKCDKLCESIISDTTNIPVSGKNFKLFSLMFMYYWKYNKMETASEARRVSEELLHYFGDVPEKRAFRRNIRCLLAGIATYEYHIRNYRAANDIYRLIVKTSYSNSEYHKRRPLVAVPNDMLNIFSQFRMGVAKIADWRSDGLCDINEAVARALNIVGNTTLHEYVNRTALGDEEVVHIVTMGSKHLASIVCGWGLLLGHPDCLWHLLQGIFTSDKLSQTQLLYNQLCGFDDPYGKSFDFWQEVPQEAKFHELNSAMPLCSCTILLLVLLFRYAFKFYTRHISVMHSV